MADKSLKKGRYTKYSNKIGLYSNSKGSFIKNDTEVVLNFPFKDTVLEAGMSKEDVGREERFLHIEIDSKDIDTLEEPKVLTDFRYIDKDGEKALTADSDIEFFDEDGNLKQNLLIKGNNLLALHTLKSRLAGKVKLIYIDPPFNTGGDGFKYNDNFNHSAWLAFMKNRLEAAKDLLSDEGVIFVHLDYHEVHYAKVLMDEVFGADNFLNHIIWAYSGPSMTNRFFPRKHDDILFYSKGGEYTFNQPRIEHKSGVHNTGQVFGARGNTDEGSSKQQEMEEKGKKLEDWWTDIYSTDRYRAEKIQFDGQKPEKLLQRIIEATTNEGDIVLDYHLGTGTTSAVAHKMNRRWVGIEQMDYIEDVAIDRLLKVIDGDQTGISKNVGWNGGGSFIYFELKKYNQEYVDRIMKANSLSELEELYVEMRNNAFLKFWFDRKEFEKDENFRNLDISKRKQKLVEVLDENQLYLNYADMNDTRHKVSDDEKVLTDKFYGTEEN